MVDGGYKLLCDRTVFIYHHGFKTGERLHGASNVSNGWNSYEMMEKTNRAIIAKHGFARWQKLMLSIMKAENYNEYTSEIDTEGKIIRKIVPKKGKIYELGCGGQLTVKGSIGVDAIPNGDIVDTIGVKSVATIHANVEEKLPFEDADVLIARHILEHMVDPIKALTYWYHALKTRCVLIVAVPDEDLQLTIPLNSQHIHAYTKPILNTLFCLTRLTYIELCYSKTGI